jgi:LuxR family maltose regulon positive regulatory protein
VKAALGESLYEKGGSAGEILPMLTQAQIESESSGVPEITFAAVGVRVRLTLSCGNLSAAKTILDAFERQAREQGAGQLLPNIAALRCRLSLHEGDQEAVCRWLETAPSEDRSFYILERYRYLTKVRCYLSRGEYMLALALLERLRYCAEAFCRTYIRMEVGVLSAIAKYRLGMEWREELLTALREAGSYGFLRLISEEGAAVRELLRQMKPETLEREGVDRAWLKRLFQDTEEMALRYPVYLSARLAELPDFSENALAVLRLQADGLSNGQIAQRLQMNLETVKYHAKSTYKKLGVSGRAEAVLAARDLGLL